MFWEGFEKKAIQRTTIARAIRNRIGKFDKLEAKSKEWGDTMWGAGKYKDASPGVKTMMNHDVSKIQEDYKNYAKHKLTTDYSD